uniref:Uncharacterized protein n=1 Tax=Monopterus albus TaxID=43700 RepID=A0A3Q3JTE3_MONAL
MFYGQQKLKKMALCQLQKRCVFSYLDSSTSAFTNSIRHSSTRRVDHGHEANEAKFLSGEVHLFSVKSKAFWELVIRQVEMAETLMGKKARRLL